MNDAELRPDLPYEEYRENVMRQMADDRAAFMGWSPRRELVEALATFEVLKIAPGIRDGRPHLDIGSHVFGGAP